MDATELKSLLKRAREAISKKDFKAAIKICKTILKTDKENYNAWVFIAAAMLEMGQFEQSEMAFKKAIEFRPDQLLAWQGLTNFYEKQNNTAKQIDSLIKVARLLRDDKDKQVETVEKLVTLSTSLEDKEKVFEILQLQIEISENEPAKCYELCQKLFRELNTYPSLDAKMIEMREATLTKMIKNPLFSEWDCKQMISPYTKLLTENVLPEENLKIVKAIWFSRRKSKSCLEFLLEAAIYLYINDDIVIEDLEEMLVNAKDSNISPLLYDLLKGLLLLTQEEYVSGLTLLRKVVKEKICIEAWFLLSKFELKFHRYKDAVNSAKKGLKLVKRFNPSPRCIGRFYLFLGRGLAGCKNWEKSLQALEKSTEYLGRTESPLTAICQTLLEIELLERAEIVFLEICSVISHSSAAVLQLEGHLHLLKKEYTVALEKLKESMCLENSASTLHLFGRALWETDQCEKAFKVFCKAAEMDPYYYKNYLYMGQFYSLHAKSTQSARMCYERAFDLNCSDEDTGKSLSNILRTIGDHESNFKVLTKISVTSFPDSCKWIWIQLGFYQMERKLINKAVYSFQRAVRHDALNSCRWGTLGDAYFKRGSYECATKAYQRASELNSNDLHSLYRISTIYKMKQMYCEAIEKFESILKIDPNYVPALIGLAESYYLFGQMLYKRCIFGKAVNCIQEVFNILARVAVINVNLLSLWILAGNACTFCFHFRKMWFPIIVPAELKISSQKDVYKEEILALGTRFYGRALKLKSSLSSLWHKLGVNYFFQSQNSLLHTDLESENLSLKAFRCLRKALLLSPLNHEHWRVLGIIAASEGIKNYALAQHLFIKSIQIQWNNNEAWVNLGALYLKNENLLLANRSFSKSMALDPTFPMSWIGQAMIAEKVKDDEAIDLYRHSAVLCSDGEALFGYGRLVCSTICDVLRQNTEFYKCNIEEMDAINIACSHMQQFTDGNDSCPEAYMVLGKLFEKLGNFNSALEAFERALKLFEDRGQIEEIEDSRMDYARLLRKAGQNDKALMEYMKIKTVDVFYLWNVALSLYKNERFEKAFALMKRSLDICSLFEDKSDALAAMAVISLKMGEQGLRVAVELFLKSSQIKPPSVFGLLAFYATGLLIRKREIIKIAQTALRPFENQRKYSYSATTLNTINLCKQLTSEPATDEFMQPLRIWPDDSALWIQSAACLLRWHTTQENTVTGLLKIGVRHGGDKEFASQIFALSKLVNGCRKTSLTAAQTAVHIRPDNLFNWIVLAAACHASDKGHDKIGWIFLHIKKLAQKQGIESELLGWIAVIEVLHLIRCKEYVAANHLLKQAVKIDSFSSDVRIILQILDALLFTVMSGNKTTLVHLLTEHADCFVGWQVLTQFLMNYSKIDEIDKTLTEFLMAASEQSPTFRIYPSLQVAALAYKLIKVSKEREKWMGIGIHAVNTAIKITPDGQSARFFHGLFAMMLKNENLARRSLRTVIKKADVTEPKWMEKQAVKMLNVLCAKKHDKRDLKVLLEKFPENWFSYVSTS